MAEKAANAEGVRKFRKAKGWTLREMARRAGLSHGTVSQVERGRTKVTAPTARKLARVMRVRWTSICD